jgi:hypothetical protein
LAFTRNPSDTDVSPATYTADGASDLIIIDQQRDIAIDGSDKNDVIRISANALAADALYDYDVRGFAGKDSIVIEAALIQNSTINGNIGDDKIVAGELGVNGSLNGSFILGGKNNDVLDAVNISDGEVNGNLGDDKLNILGGAASFNASIRGGQGQDTIRIATGTNFQNGSIFGDKGRDNIRIEGFTGTFSNTTVFGGEDNDTIVVVAGNAATGLNLEGNKGNDSIFALGASSVTVLGGEGKDTIATGSLAAGETSSVKGGTGADTVTFGVLNAETDTYVFNSGDSVAASKVSYKNAGVATGTLAVGDKITYGNGIDTIAGFEVATDKVDIDFTAKAVVDLLAAGTKFSDVLAANTIYEVYGEFKGGVFDIQAESANGKNPNGSNQSSLYLVGGGNETLANAFQNNSSGFVSDNDLAFGSFA